MENGAQCNPVREKKKKKKEKKNGGRKGIQTTFLVKFVSWHEPQRAPVGGTRQTFTLKKKLSET